MEVVLIVKGVLILCTLIRVEVVLIVKGVLILCTLIRVEVVLIVKGGTDPVYTHQSGSCINCVYVFLFHLNSSEKFLSSISNTVDILLLKVSQI